jgi:rod shape-determining protein MreC
VNIEIAYENLRREYFQLKSETLLQKSLEEENQNLRSLLNASKRIEEKITLAELINVSIDPYNHRVLINKGLRHNVSVGQAIIDDKGVVGQVTEVMPFNSSVMLLTDPSHAIPVQIKRTGLRTVVFGTGNVALLKVPFLNQNTDIEIGDELYSSGLGARFPSGYPVAKVTDIQILPDEAFIRISAEPITRLDRSKQVLLLSKVEREVQ